MSEEVKEQLSKQEYDKVGEMLLELIKACPKVPEDLKDKEEGILYQSMSTGRCLGIITLPGAKYVGHDITGGFTAKVNFQVAYKSMPKSNNQRIDAQNVVDQIMGWLEDVQNLPKLTDGRKVTEITASSSFATVDEVNNDKSTIFISDAVMEYKKKGI